MENDSDRKLLVSLVDSNEEIISSVRQIFSEIRECRLETMHSYEEALQKVSEAEPDLLLFSGDLSGGSGLDFIGKIYKKHPTIFAIVLLPPGAENLVTEFIQAGINGFAVTDQNFLSILIAAIKKALIRIVERNALLLSSLSGTSFSLDQEDDLLHLSAFQPGDKVLQYRILEEIAEGGMGQIYRAEDEILRRKVALKVLPQKVTKNEKAKKRMLREARLAAALNHPNICSVYEVGEKDGHTFISMEYVEGITLHKRIESGPLEMVEVLRIAIQIADALREAHKNKIIHRDIKSLNIILTDRKHVKVLDFGLAKRLSDIGIWGADTRPSTQITEAGEVMGTLHFMSPEQALGKTADYRSDIFSFGVVLYHMLTGTVPFTGNSISQFMDSILNSDPVPIVRFNKNAPPQLVRLVYEMMNKDPNERCQMMEHVWYSLRHIQKEISPKKQIPPESKRRFKASTNLKELWATNRARKQDDPEA